MVALASLVDDRCSRTDPRVLKTAVERRLAALLPSGSGGDLGEALRYAVLAPGKRIRPILTILAGWEIGASDLRLLDAGCALEMVHAASLILDDMPAMDDALTRRGQPATHIKFGEDTAMLAAITLLSRAYGVLGSMKHVDPERRCRFVEILARAVGTEGLAGGQHADLRPRLRAAPQAVEDANLRKTGALFVAAFELAAAFHGLEGPAVRPWRSSGVHLGHAYQMLDDFADSVASAEGDAIEDAGKTTLLALLGHDAARAKLHHHVEGALEGISRDGILARYLSGLFAGSAGGFQVAAQ